MLKNATQMVLKVQQQGVFFKICLLTLFFMAATFVPVPAVSFGAALILVIVLPGFQILRWLGLYADWREARTIILAVAAGILGSPVVVYWASKFLGFNRPVVFLALFLFIIGLAGLNRWRPVAGRNPKPLLDTRRQYVLLSLLLAGLAVGIVIPYVRGYTAAGVYPVEMADWFKHYGVSWSIRYTGVPPVDIFFYGDPARGRLSYYYFFHLTVATLDLLHSGPSSIYLSFAILTLATSLSFVGVFYLLAQRVLANTKAALWSVLFATVIGGLDVIPMIPYCIEQFKKKFTGGPFDIILFALSTHIDSWSPAPYLRLNALYVLYIWVPQHVTGLLAFFLGLYFFREIRYRIRLLTALPLLLLTVLGHSAWIAMVSFVCVALYALYDVGKRWRDGNKVDAQRVFGGYALVAFCFLVISSPFLLELIGPNAPKSGIVFEIPQSGDWLVPFKTYFSDTPWTRLLDLPVHYFFEFGALLVCGLGGLWLFKTNRRQEPLMPLFLLALITGFLVISFFASGRAWVSLGFTLNNDLGMRAIMPAQAILALFSGYFWVNLPKLRFMGWLKVFISTFIGGIMVLGIMAVGWEGWAMGLAKYFKPPRIDTATYQAFQAMPAFTEPLAIVKHRTHDNASSYQLEFAARPPGFFTVEAAVFHPDLREVGYQFGLSRFAYLNRLPVWSYQMFREMYANYVYLGPADRTLDLYPEKFENSTFFEKVYAQDGIDIYKVKNLPLDQLQARFDPTGVQFMGYIIDKSPVYPGGFQTSSPRALVTAWQLEQPVKQNYTVYVHFTRPDGTVIGQADHQLWTWANQAEGPTSTWPAGKIYLDITPLPKEVLGSPVPLQIGIGLWVPETGEYLQAQPVNLTLDPNHRLVIGTLEPTGF